MEKGKSPLYRYRVILRLREKELTVIKEVELETKPEQIYDFVCRHNIDAYERFPLRPYIQGKPRFIGKV